MSVQLDDGLRLVGPADGRYAEILTPEALALVERLHRTFATRRDEELTRRAARRIALLSGEARWGFRPETAAIREDADWRVPPPPPGLGDRRVEIASPAEPKRAVHALNSGAPVWMADLEDGLSPTWENVIGGHLTLLDAAHRRLGEGEDERYRLKENDLATMVVRPRGLHLPEPGLTFCGRPAIAALVDFGLFMVHCARPLIDAGAGPYLYLAKLQSTEEARLWNEIFLLAQDELGLPTGTIRATVLIETLPAAFEMEEILYELREHAAGLTAGRWDYMFSAIKALAFDRSAILPDRNGVTMTVPFMRAYTELLVETAHKRGTHAIGGVAAFIPGRDREANVEALTEVRADKDREAAEGFDGSWVAHPGLVETCREAFDAVLGGAPNQIDRVRGDLAISTEQLLALGETPGDVTLSGVRANIAVALRYLEGWLRGLGAVVIRGRMEDAGTAEISRIQLWQWIHHGVSTRDGRVVSQALVRQMIAAETAAARAEAGGGSTRFSDARELLEALIYNPSPAAFFTTFAGRQYLRSQP